MKVEETSEAEVTQGAGVDAEKEMQRQVVRQISFKKLVRLPTRLHFKTR